MHPVAIVGIAAIMPQAPDAATFWANITRRPLRDHRRPARALGPGALLRRGPRGRPTRPTRRSAAGCASSPGTRSAWKLPIPPKVAAADGRRASSGRSRAARSALLDAGWPDWDVDSERVAVILGNAIGGEKHYRPACASSCPRCSAGLAGAPSLAALPGGRAAPHRRGDPRGLPRRRSSRSTRTPCPASCPTSSPAGSPTCSTSAGPTSPPTPPAPRAWPRSSAAVQGLVGHEYDAVVTGGVDRNMGVAGFVKFCKIGALSATGTRPFDAGADGFVMGEGAALFVLKRLEDAERDGDRIYAVILGVGGSSDGKGKGITAPNPVGQKLAVERAWATAGPGPRQRRRDRGARHVHPRRRRRRAEQPHRRLRQPRAPGSHRARLGEVQHRPPQGRRRHRRAVQDGALRCTTRCSPRASTSATPTRTSTGTPPRSRSTPSCATGPRPPSGARRGGVSAFGFGGTNFHVVLEEHVPGRHKPAPQVFAVGRRRSPRSRGPPAGHAPPSPPRPRCAAPWSSAAGTTPTLLAAAARGARRRPRRPGPGARRTRRRRRWRAPVRVGRRLRRRRRAGRQARQARQGLRLGQPGPVPDAAPAGRLRRPRPGAQGGLPLHRPGLAVRQHAQGPARPASRSSATPSPRPTTS